MISPAFSAAPVTKAKVKKLAKKAVKQNIDDFGNPIFIEETELYRFGLIKMNIGDADKPVGTFGPFTVVARCLDTDPALDVDIAARLIISTSENDSILDTDETDEYDFDPTDADIEWGANDTTDQPGDPASSYYEEIEGFAAAPSGYSIDGRTAIYTNFAGAHCAFHGWYMTTSPQ